MDNDKFISFMEDIIHKPWKKNLNWYVIYLWARKLYLYQWLRMALQCMAEWKISF